MTLFGRLATLAVLSLAVLLPYQSAQAAEEETLVAVLKGLEWGKSSQDVLAHFEETLMETFREETKDILDPVKINKMRKTMEDDYKRIEESYTRLEGSKKTGLEVSVVATEYGKNNGEAVIIVREDIAQKYYFFGDNMLYKLAVAYNADYLQGIGFEAFVGEVSKKYGEPDETIYDDWEEELLQAIWHGDKTDLRIENKSDFFGTYMMVFCDRDTEARLAKLRTAYGTNESGDEISINSDIIDAGEEDPFSADEDVVDDILGVKTEIDLSDGMPQEEQIRRVGDGGGKGDIDGVDGLPDEQKKKRKKKKKKKNKKLETEKPAEDIIIY